MHQIAASIASRTDPRFASPNGNQVWVDDALVISSRVRRVWLGGVDPDRWIPLFREGDPVADWPGHFWSSAIFLGEVAFTGPDQCVLHAAVQAGGEGPVIYGLFAADRGGMRTLIRGGITLPGNRVLDNTIASGFVASASGDVAAVLRVVGQGGHTVARIRDGGVTPLCRTSDPAPGLPGYVVTSSRPTLRISGAGALWMTLWVQNEAVSGSGMVILRESDNQWTIPWKALTSREESSEAPGTDGDRFSSLGEVRITSEEKIAFSGNTVLGTDGIWSGTVGDLQLRAWIGQEFGEPVVGRLQTFYPNALEITRDGSVVFRAQYQAAGDSRVQTGIFLSSPRQSLRLMAASGASTPEFGEGWSLDLEGYTAVQTFGDHEMVLSGWARSPDEPPVVVHGLWQVGDAHPFRLILGAIPFDFGDGIVLPPASGLAVLRSTNGEDGRSSSVSANGLLVTGLSPQPPDGSFGRKLMEKTGPYLFNLLPGKASVALAPADGPDAPGLTLHLEPNKPYAMDQSPALSGTWIPGDPFWSKETPITIRPSGDPDAWFLRLQSP